MSLIKEMAQELGPIIASAVSHKPSTSYYVDEEEAKRVGRLVKRVSKFDGSATRAITPWLTYMQRFFAEYEIHSEKRKVLAILECLEGEAGDYIGGCS